MSQNQWHQQPPPVYPPPFEAMRLTVQDEQVVFMRYRMGLHAYGAGITVFCDCCHQDTTRLPLYHRSVRKRSRRKRRKR